jgi:hypothetical protein
MELDEPRLLHIWSEVSLGRGRHGDFLKAFADAYIRADHMNVQLIGAGARALVVKYSLDRYLDNFENENFEARHGTS